MLKEISCKYLSSHDNPKFKFRAFENEWNSPNFTRIPRSYYNIAAFSTQSIVISLFPIPNTSRKIPRNGFFSDCDVVKRLNCFFTLLRRSFLKVSGRRDRDGFLLNRLLRLIFFPRVLAIHDTQIFLSLLSTLTLHIYILTALTSTTNDSNIFTEFYRNTFLTPL